MDIEIIKPIILRHLRDELREEDLATLHQWLAESPANQALLARLEDPERVGPLLARMEAWQQEHAWQRVHHYLETRKSEEASFPMVKTKYNNGFRWMAAAVLIGLLGIGTWWMVRSHSQPASPNLATTAQKDVAAPQTNRATLTLSTGQKVFLDSAADGELARQGGAQVVKRSNGQLAYLPGGGSSAQGKPLYNTLFNPRGSQVVHVTLSDSTQVWLNAESSLRYPVAFTGANRTVEVTGEAYFEVAPNANKPFRVNNGSTTVDVLGTKFNVNAYTDEPALKVTLLDGKVQVRKDASTLVLTPGRQAIVTTGISEAAAIDTATVMAWKNGRFAFSKADLPTVMRTLARWYDVDVRYEGELPQRAFTGKFSRTLTLDQVLHVLTNHHIRYTIEPDRKLIIKP